MAANWVAAAKAYNYAGFQYFEVGNENYGTWEADNNNRPHDPVTYATRFVQYITYVLRVSGVLCRIRFVVLSFGVSLMTISGK